MKIQDIIKENEEGLEKRLKEELPALYNLLETAEIFGMPIGVKVREWLVAYFHLSQLRLLSAFKEMVEKTKLYKQDYSSGKFNLMTGTAKSKTILKTAKELKDDLLSSLTQELTEKE